MSFATILKDILSQNEVPAWAITSIILFVFAYQQFKSRMEQRQQYKTSKIQAFLEKLPTIRGANRAILVEQLFLDRFGQLMSYSEIEFFLSMKNPSQNIVAYLASRRFFERGPEKDVVIIEKYASDATLKSCYRRNLAMYVVSGCACLILLLLAKTAFAANPMFWIPYLFYVLATSMTAFLGLEGAVGANLALELKTAIAQHYASNSSKSEAEAWPWGN